jgi:putative photosynthetic complex assembly protein
MSAHDHANTVPRPALWLAGALVGFALLSTAVVRIGQVPPAASPVLERAAAHAAPVAEARLRFLDRADGGVSIERVGGGVTILPPGSHSGFIRGVMRGLARDRRMRGLDAAAPFVLTEWTDGGLSLADTATGRVIELNGFGVDNRAAFAALLKGGR